MNNLLTFIFCLFFVGNKKTAELIQTELPDAELHLYTVDVTNKELVKTSALRYDGDPTPFPASPINLSYTSLFPFPFSSRTRGSRHQTYHHQYLFIHLSIYSFIHSCIDSFVVSFIQFNFNSISIQFIWHHEKNTNHKYRIHYRPGLLGSNLCLYIHVCIRGSYQGKHY